MARVNKTITCTGSPQNIGQLFGYNNVSGGVAVKGSPMIIERVFIQMKAGGTNIGYVMDGIPEGTTPDPTTSGLLTAQLAAASAGAPGGSYSDRISSYEGNGIVGSELWIQGTLNEEMIVSVNTKS